MIAWHNLTLTHIHTWPGIPNKEQKEKKTSNPHTHEQQTQIKDTRTDDDSSGVKTHAQTTLNHQNTKAHTSIADMNLLLAKPCYTERSRMYSAKMFMCIYRLAGLFYVIQFCTTKVLKNIWRKQDIFKQVIVQIYYWEGYRYTVRAIDIW